MATPVSSQTGLSFNTDTTINFQTMNAKDKQSDSVREAMKFFFSKDGKLFRELVLDEICNGIDALSRDVVQEIIFRITGIQKSSLPFFIRIVLPPLTPDDQKVIESNAKLIKFLLNDFSSSSSEVSSQNNLQELLSLSRRQISRENINKWLPLLREFAPNIRSFGFVVLNKLIDKGASRVLRAAADSVFGPENIEFSRTSMGSNSQK
jgi:hypothetical protein